MSLIYFISCLHERLVKNSLLIFYAYCFHAYLTKQMSAFTHNISSSKMRGMLLYYKRAITLKYYYIVYTLHASVYTKFSTIPSHFAYVYCSMHLPKMSCPSNLSSSTQDPYVNKIQYSVYATIAIISTKLNSDHDRVVQCFSIQEILQNVWHFIACVNMCEYEKPCCSSFSSLSLLLSWTLSPVETRFSERSCMHSK